MKLIVVSSANKSKSEIRHIVDFFEGGMDLFHIKKKGFSKRKMEDYIKMIPKKYHSKLVLHSHYGLASKYSLRGIHISRSKKNKKGLGSIRYWYTKLFNGKLHISKSFHSIQGMVNDSKKYDYVFLSPVFDNHNMSVFSAAFSEKQLRNVLYKTKHNVVALGGVTTERVEVARRTGFYGTALHSTIWREKADRAGVFNAIANETARVAKEVN